MALSRIFQKSSYFITSLILARLLGPEGRGLVSALLVPSQLAVNFSEMGIRQATAFYIGRGEYSVDELTPTLLSLVPLAGILAMALSLAYLQWAGIAHGDGILLALSVAAIPASLATSYASGVFLGRGRIAAFRSTSWRPALLRLVLIMGLAWFAGLGVYGVLAANFAAAALGGGYALYLLSKEAPLRPGFDIQVATNLQRKGLSYAASLFVLMVNYRIMILLLTRFSSLKDVGIYAQATTLAELIWEIPTAVSALLLSRAVSAKNGVAFARKVLVLARVSFLAAVAGGAVLAAASTVVFPLLFGHRFVASSAVCDALIPGIVAFIVFKILNTDLAGRGRPMLSTIIMAPALAINVGVGAVMIMHFGALGAAGASSLTYVVATALYMVLYSRVTGITLTEMVVPQSTDFQQLRAHVGAAALKLRAWRSS